MVKVLRKVKGEPTEIYYDGKLQDLLDGFKKAIQKNRQSVVIVCDGRSGMGKSTFSNQVGKYLDLDFDLDNLHFTPDDFLTALKNAKKGEMVILDEAMMLSNRASMSEINRAVVIAMSMIRSKCIYVVFNINSAFDLDKNLILHRADVLFHIYGESLIDRGRFTTFFRGQDGFDRLKFLYLLGKKFYDYSKPKSNFYGRFTKNFIVDEDEYEAKKQIGINKFLKLGFSKSNAKGMRHRNILIRWIYNKKLLNLVEIGELLDLDASSIGYAVRKDEKEDGKDEILT